MINDALAALMEVLSPPFRAVLIKVLGLTVLILAVLVGLIHHVLLAFVTLPYLWLDTTISVLAGLGLVIGSVFLVAPVSSLVAGFFIDDLAELVERDIDPGGPPGRPLPILQALVLSVRFAALSLGVTILALLLLLVPGVNAVAFIGANAYLLGRQYFEFVALRHMRFDEANIMRHRYGGRLWAAGLVLALFVSVPLLNLLTPLFGAAFMVRVFKRLPRAGGVPAARPRAG
ncbi:MAG TPA: sulfate transporter family protein [Lichenihabitans sp.]|jgi:CysZ protein|nr:sulfate transporter family protein [Lichenihabitans sp.]